MVGGSEGEWPGGCLQGGGGGKYFLSGGKIACKQKDPAQGMKIIAVSPCCLVPQVADFCAASSHVFAQEEQQQRHSRGAVRQMEEQQSTAPSSRSGVRK